MKTPRLLQATPERIFSEQSSPQETTSKRTKHLFISSFVLILFLFLSGCEKELLQPEEAKTTTSQSSSLSKNFAARITYDEKMITTSTQWPGSITGGLKKRSESELHLTDYANTRKTIKRDTLGNSFIEVEYIEGNANIRMPMEMYNKIKDKTNPVDPKTNPMKRYTIENGKYTAYGVNGSVIYTATFPKDSIVFDTSFSFSGKINSKLGLCSVTERNTKPVYEIVSNYIKKGINCKALGENGIVIEQQIKIKSGTIIAKSVIDAKTGLLQRTGSYNKNGQLENVVLFSYKNVDGYYYPATVVTYSMDKLQDGTWGISTKTIQARTNLKIETK